MIIMTEKSDIQLREMKILAASLAHKRHSVKAGELNPWQWEISKPQKF